MVFLYGGSRVIDGAITLGTFTAFMAYQIRLIGPVQGLMGLYTGLASARVSLQARARAARRAGRGGRRRGAGGAGPVRGEIVFEDVSCGHGRGGAVLEDFRLTIAPGEVVALTGPSGSGKSTVADLIVRHLDPDRRPRPPRRHRHPPHQRWPSCGRRWRWSTRRPSSSTPRSWRTFATPAPDADPAEVMRAVERAGLGAFVAALPDGLGHGGGRATAGSYRPVSVSGSRSRGRSWRTPAVLVLDEATSALDAAAEAQVVGAYREVMRGADDGADYAPGGDAAGGGSGGGGGWGVGW